MSRALALYVLLTAADGRRFVQEAATSTAQLAKFPDMWFGLATAAPHVEKAYPNDPWVAWAKRGHVAAYKSEIAGPYPDERLRFLEEPEIEIDLAAKTGVSVFRLGLDWGRLVTSHPGYADSDAGKINNHTALARYKEIVGMIKTKGMKVMLTLFHHSMPLWSSAFGGWLEDATVNHFLAFAKDVAVEFGDSVDYWVTFNEPHVYVLLSNCAGLWPPGPEKSAPESMACLQGALPFVESDSGGYTKAMGNIERAHKQFYAWAHGSEGAAHLKSPRIGVAHNVAENEAHTWTDTPIKEITENLFKFAFIDSIKGDLDWLGLNYYGKEVLGSGGPVILDTEEYSESGRTVHPDGLYNVLMQFHQRFPVGSEGVKFKSIIVTENGISDATDILRPSYLIEHLLAIREAQNQGVPVEGYVHWTISDNWEWADGYCPKFGLVDVDRSTTEFTRTPRGSYDVYTAIVKSKMITKEQRSAAWSAVTTQFLSGTTRPFCRSSDGKNGLDMPVQRPVIAKDWRFSKLSKEEDGACHLTDWRPSKNQDPENPIAVKTDGSCEVLPSAKHKVWCPQAVVLEREKRCPGAKAVTETSASVCSGARNAKKDGDCRTSGLAGTMCCCDASKCGWASYAMNCPSGLKYEKDDKCSK